MSANDKQIGEFDLVNKPKHYMLFDEHGIEVRDVINCLLVKMENCDCFSFKAKDYADYVQMMQYGMRFMEKNGVQDLKKMRVYLDWLICNMEKSSADA